MGVYKMASTMEERNDPDLRAQDSARPSLLEVIEDRNRTLSKKYLVHRLIYVSKIRGTNVDRNAVGGHSEQLMKKLQNDYPGSEPITGLMLIYMKHIVHVVETSSDLILKIVEDLQRMEEDDDTHIEKSKILINSHDIQTRLFQQWIFRTLDIVEHGIEAYETNDSFENLIVEVITQILKLGVFFIKQPKLNLKNAMDTLHEKVPDLLPQQSLVHYLLEENDSAMMTTKDFISLYEKPFDTCLESDMAWPIPTRLFPYN